MSTQSSLLPAGFDALVQLVDAGTIRVLDLEFVRRDETGTHTVQPADLPAAGRARCRDLSDEASRVAFYNAANELVPKALACLDKRPLDQLDESEQRLMRLVLSFAHVAMAVELQREEEPRHARYRPYMRITRAPADL